LSESREGTSIDCKDSHSYRLLGMGRKEDMNAQQERQGERIPIAMPIQVFGTEITGQDFMEMTQTSLLCRDGAAIQMTHRLAPMQQITLRNVSTGVEAFGRVIGEVSARPNARVYGIALLDARVKLWNVSFPEEQSSAACSAQQRWLECNGCQGREIAALGTLECDVFQASRSLTRQCRWCGQATVWHLASHEAPAHKVCDPPRRPRGPAPTANESKARALRKHSRVQMKTAGCVREPGFGINDFVQVEDLSRGGLSFLSANAYRSGTLLQVSAPYMKGTENMFMLARVRRVEPVKENDRLKRYGVSFVKNSEES
jgi:PilZ domain